MNTASTNRPPIWQLIRDAIAPLGREVTYAEVKQLLWVQYPDLKSETINCQLIICSVNAPSRVHYPENKKPRPANGQYDFLYNIGRGKVVWYNPAKHGAWEIVKAADGALSVHRCDYTLDSIADEEPEAMDASPDPYGSGLFAMEAHLRDYLAKNPPTLPGAGRSASPVRGRRGPRRRGVPDRGWPAGPAVRRFRGRPCGVRAETRRWAGQGAGADPSLHGLGRETPRPGQEGVGRDCRLVDFRKAAVRGDAGVARPVARISARRVAAPGRVATPVRMIGRPA